MSSYACRAYQKQHIKDNKYIHGFIWCNTHTHQPTCALVCAYPISTSACSCFLEEEKREKERNTLPLLSFYSAKSTSVPTNTTAKNVIITSDSRIGNTRLSYGPSIFALCVEECVHWCVHWCEKGIKRGGKGKKGQYWFWATAIVCMHSS